MTMQYDLLLVGRRWRLSVPVAVEVSASHAEFLMPAVEEITPFAEVCYTPVGLLPEPPEDFFCRQSCLFSQKENDLCWHLNDFDKPPVAVSDYSQAPEKVTVSYLSSFEPQLTTSLQILRLLQVEKLLTWSGALMLHSSLIRTPRGCIAFSGDSGVGKSTQASLWEEYRRAEVLNGDRSGLIHTENGFQAWGLPFAGSSLIYRNDCGPLSSIVLLSQSEKNSIVRIGPAEAFARLYPQLNIHQWNKRYCSLAADLLLEIVRSVPVFWLSCRPDEAAVALTEQNVFGVLC